MKKLPHEPSQYGPDGFAQLNDINFTAMNTNPPGTLFAIQTNPLVGCRCPLFVMSVINPAPFDCADVYLCLTLIPGFGPNTYLSVDIFNNLIWVPFINPLPPVLHNNTIYVDTQYGNDGTGVRENVNLPFKTINAALAISLSGDLIHVRPGTYDEQIVLLNERHFYLDKGAEITTTLPGYIPVITDGGFSVSCDIYGEGRIFGDGKQLLLFGLGSYIRLKLDQLDNINSQAGDPVLSSANMVIEANKIDFPILGTAFPGNFTNSSAYLHITCPDVNAQYLGLDGSTATVIGNIKAYTLAGNTRFTLSGDSFIGGTVGGSPTSEINHHGNMTNPGGVFGLTALSTSFEYTYFTGKITSTAIGLVTTGSPTQQVFGKADIIISGVGGGNSGMLLFSGNTSWYGDIYSENPISFFGFGGTAMKVDIRGNLYGTNPFGSGIVNSTAATLATQSLNIYGDIIGNGYPVAVLLDGNLEFRAHGLIDPGVSAGGTAINMLLTYGGITNLQNAKSYSYGGVASVLYDGGFLELDDSIFVPAVGSAFSITSVGAPTMKIYDSSFSNTIFNPAIIPLINVGPTGFIVDPNVV